MLHDAFCPHCEDQTGGCWSCRMRADSARTEDFKRRMLRDPWRPVDWPKELTDVEKRFSEEMAKSFAKGREVTSEQTRRIDEDVALLLLAGISFHRVAIATYQDEPLKRSIMVDGKSVRDYMIKVVAEE